MYVSLCLLPTLLFLKGKFVQTHIFSFENFEENVPTFAKEKGWAIDRGVMSFALGLSMREKYLSRK